MTKTDELAVMLDIYGASWALLAIEEWLRRQNREVAASVVSRVRLDPAMIAEKEPSGKTRGSHDFA